MGEGMCIGGMRSVRLCIYLYVGTVATSKPMLKLRRAIMRMYFEEFWRFAINFVAIYSVARIKYFITIDLEMHPQSA